MLTPIVTPLVTPNYHPTTPPKPRGKIVATVAAVALLGASGSASASVAPHAPKYSEREVNATFTARIPAGASVSVVNPCPKLGEIGNSFTEVSAYKAGGAAMGPQRYSEKSLLASWRYPGTKSWVTWNGVTFRNLTRHVVLVAGWCGDESD